MLAWQLQVHSERPRLLCQRSFELWIGLPSKRIRGKTVFPREKQARLPQICRFGCPEGIDWNKFTLITAFSFRARPMDAREVHQHPRPSVARL